MRTDIPELVTRLRAGDRRALARALSLIEGADAGVVRALVAAVHPLTGGAHLIGLTGAPGVGKSTLTAALTAELRRHGDRVAVLAVDPSSPFTGGALLGDRVRMADHVLDDGVFIRSMATRGHLGGLAWAAPHALMVLEAAGYDVVIIETVGVGQAEVEIAEIADTTVVVQAPGMGDAVQAAKAGILEIADVHVVNKADRPEAERTVRELEGMLALAPEPEAQPGAPNRRWQPQVLRTVASSGDGVAPLCERLRAHLEWAEASGARAARRERAGRLQVREILLASIRTRLDALDEGRAMADAARAVAQREVDPYTAADRLLSELA